MEALKNVDKQLQYLEGALIYNFNFDKKGEEPSSSIFTFAKKKKTLEKSDISKELEDDMSKLEKTKKQVELGTRHLKKEGKQDKSNQIPNKQSPCTES